MGVIKKVVYRGNVLGEPRHRNFFLDMEENIHIHYRDLRIELSRGEFEDIVSAFVKQSAELMAIIAEKHYQDGKLANANQEDVRIWTESRLKHDVKYHPARLSLEECGDGYHFHYRNYKFLIDPPEFRRMMALFKSLDLDAPYASAYEEIVDLLKANDVDFVLDAGNQPDQKLVIRVAKYHLPKIRDIFNYIGFAEEIAGSGKRYVGSQLVVEVQSDVTWSPMDYRRMRSFSQVGLLMDYIARSRENMTPNEINYIKCQVLDVYCAMNGGSQLDVETNPWLWLYSPSSQQVIFPYRSGIHCDAEEANQLYQSWSAILKSFDMGFVKPGKEKFQLEVQNDLKDQVEAAIRKNIAAYVAVNRVYLMGSEVRGEMGAYQVPFVHGKLAKLGSDVDILIEMDAAREEELPRHWKLYVKEASNHCAVYHVGEIPLAGLAPDWRRQFPHIDFIDHLLDAYVYFPSRGYRDEVDAFLRKFGARCQYDRARDGIYYCGEVEERIAARLSELYGFVAPAVEPMKVSTKNSVYLVAVGNTDYVLKLFRDAGNHHRDQVADHTRYEKELIVQLRERAIVTPSIIETSPDVDAKIEELPALLFERIDGLVQQRPEYPIDRIAPALAKIHQTQIEKPLNLDLSFTFDNICMIWLPQFAHYLARRDFIPEIAAAFSLLAPLVEPLHSGDYRGVFYAHSPSVHCHGDVTPKNVIIDKSGQVQFFDFNNAFYGPRMADVIDGAFEFFLAEKYVHLADFRRFDAFIEQYRQAAELSADEQDDLPHWVNLIGIIKFAKEVRVATDPSMTKPYNLRTKRALAIAGFLESRC